jgi:hypothetical protein
MNLRIIFKLCKQVIYYFEMVNLCENIKSMFKTKVKRNERSKKLKV